MLCKISILAKHKAADTPIKPKNGAEVGHVSYDTVDVDILITEKLVKFKLIKISFLSKRKRIYFFA